MARYFTYNSDLAGTLAYEIMSRNRVPGVQFISIWGASGTGKTTLSKDLSRLLPNSAVVNIDRYLSPNLMEGLFDHVSHTHQPFIEGLDPAIWDQHLLQQHLLLLSNNKSVEMPIFDHRLRKRVGYETFTPKRTIIVEGAYSLQNVVSSKISFSIMLLLPFHDRFIRKLVRAYHLVGRRDLDESITRYITRTEPSARFYEQKYSLQVDVIAEGRSSPYKEFIDLMQTDSIGGVHFRDLVPKSGYGHLTEGERLRLYEHKDSLSATLTYTLKDRKVFDISISAETVDLLLSCYE